MLTVGDGLPPCPVFASEFTWGRGELLAYTMCAHECAATEVGAADRIADSAVRDAYGNALEGGETVTLVKSVKLAGGGGTTLKVGTKVTRIRLTEDTGDGHDIDARIPEVGRLKLKSSIVKKA